jgi:hypothetical protein
MADAERGLAEHRPGPPAERRAGTPDGQGPEALTRDIEETRENLARTIDAIADRVSPKNAARRAADRARERVDRARQRIDPLDPRLIAAGAVLAAGLTAYLVLRRRRR